MPFQGNPPAQVQQKTPYVKQESSGPNSPNVITGDHSTVNINTTPPPKGVFIKPIFRDKDKPLTLWLGDIQTHFSMVQLPKSPINMGGFIPITIVNVNGDARVDAFLDGTSTPAVELKGGDFLVRNPRWDKNFDDMTALSRW